MAFPQTNLDSHAQVHLKGWHGFTRVLGFALLGLVIIVGGLALFTL